MVIQAPRLAEARLGECDGGSWWAGSDEGGRGGKVGLEVDVEGDMWEGITIFFLLIGKYRSPNEPCVPGFRDLVIARGVGIGEYQCSQSMLWILALRYGRETKIMEDRMDM